MPREATPEELEKYRQEVEDNLNLATQLAYDRAGLGLSDPGPSPRDGLAIAYDLERLLAEAGEAGPYLLVGHSMAGLHTRLFAGRNPGLLPADAFGPRTGASARRMEGLPVVKKTWPPHWR